MIEKSIDQTLVSYRFLEGAGQINVILNQAVEEGDVLYVGFIELQFNIYKVSDDILTTNVDNPKDFNISDLLFYNYEHNTGFHINFTNPSNISGYVDRSYCIPCNAPIPSGNTSNFCINYNCTVITTSHQLFIPGNITFNNTNLNLTSIDIISDSYFISNSIIFFNSSTMIANGCINISHTNFIVDLTQSNLSTLVLLNSSSGCLNLSYSITYLNRPTA